MQGSVKVSFKKVYFSNITTPRLHEEIWMSTDHVLDEEVVSVTELLDQMHLLLNQVRSILDSEGWKVIHDSDHSLCTHTFMLTEMKHTSEVLVTGS